MITAENRKTRLDTAHDHLARLLVELYAEYQDAVHNDASLKPYVAQTEDLQKRLSKAAGGLDEQAALYVAVNDSIVQMLEQTLNGVVHIGNKDFHQKVRDHLANDLYELTPEELLADRNFEPAKPSHAVVTIPPVEFPEQQPRFTRRRLLAGSAGLLATGVGLKNREGIERVATNEELRTLPAVLTSRETIADTVMTKCSNYQRELLWQKYFGDRPDIIPLDVWDRKYADGSDDFVSMCPWLEVLANVYRNKEKEKNDAKDLPTQDFPEYFDEFLGKIQDASYRYGIDFAIVLSLLVISGRNMTSIDGQNQDVDISRKQAFIGAIGSAFSEFPIVNASAIDRMVSDRSDALFPSLIRSISPQLPLGRWNSIRLTGVPTVGINDIEPEIIAEAIFSDERYISPELRDAFLEDPRYAECAKALKEVWRARQAVEQSKLKDIRPIAEEYLNGFGNTSIARFFDPETREQELKNIGVNPEDISGQYDTYSRAWKHVCWLENTIADDKELAQAVCEAVKFDYQWIYDHDVSSEDMPHLAGLSALMRDQIDNPRFIRYLKHRAEESGNQSELGRLRLLESNLKDLDKLADDMRAANSHATALLGKLEYDVNFQIMTGVATIKMLSKKAEAISTTILDPLPPVSDMGTSIVDPNNRDQILTNIFDTIAIREISPITLLTNELLVYPRLSKCDAPYDRDAVTRELRSFKKRCIEVGVVPAGQEDSIDFWLKLFGELALERNIRSGSRVPKGESASENSDLKALKQEDHVPVLSPDQKNALIDYFMEAVMPPFSPAFETALRYTFPHLDNGRSLQPDEVTYPQTISQVTHGATGWRQKALNSAAIPNSAIALT